MRLRRGLKFLYEKVGVNVARRKMQVANQIHCEHGVTYVNCARVTAVYKYRWWFFRVNPRLVFPAFRREHRKLIIANGKKRGWGEIRGGLIPLSRYDLPGTGLSRSIQQFIRKFLGLGCKRHQKGYIYVAIGPYRYIVLQHTTKEGLHFCEVFDKRTEEQIGNFIFNQDFTEVYPHISNDNVAVTLQVIMGYVADSMVYSMAAGHLVKTINIGI